MEKSAKDDKKESCWLNNSSNAAQLRYLSSYLGAPQKDVGIERWRQELHRSFSLVLNVLVVGSAERPNICWVAPVVQGVSVLSARTPNSVQVDSVQLQLFPFLEVSYSLIRHKVTLEEEARLPEVSAVTMKVLRLPMFDTAYMVRLAHTATQKNEDFMWCYKLDRLDSIN